MEWVPAVIPGRVKVRARVRAGIRGFVQLSPRFRRIPNPKLCATVHSVRVIVTFRGEITYLSVRAYHCRACAVGLSGNSLALGLRLGFTLLITHMHIQ